MYAIKFLFVNSYKRRYWNTAHLRDDDVAAGR